MKHELHRWLAAWVLAALLFGFLPPAQATAKQNPALLNISALPDTIATVGDGTATDATATDARPSPKSATQPTSLVYTLGSSVVSFNSQSIAVSMEEPLQVSFVGSQPVRPLAAGDADGKKLIGSVTYPDLWPGISLAYDAPNQSGLRSTYYLQPHADPAQIPLAYNQPVSIGTDGQLLVAIGGAALRESAPLAWQTVQGRDVPVQVAFRLIPGPTGEQPSLGFELGAYDPALPLTIDPTLVWNSFFGISGTLYSSKIDPTGQYIYTLGYATAQISGGGHR